jgi:predicted nucleic acid-binding protein
MRYLDTSVLVAALTREEATGRVQAWLAAQPAGSLAISEWVHTEFASALSIKVRTGELGVEERAAVLAAFARHIRKSFHVLPIPAEAFRVAAVHLNGHELGLRAGDALHLAIAQAHGATLCTLDRRMAAAATSLGVNAELP